MRSVGKFVVVLGWELRGRGREDKQRVGEGFRV
jgi:hypothetical protein